MNNQPDDGWPYASKEAQLAAHTQDAILHTISVVLVWATIALIAALLVASAIR